MCFPSFSIFSCDFPTVIEGILPSKPPLRIIPVVNNMVNNSVTPLFHVIPPKKDGWNQCPFIKFHEILFIFLGFHHISPHFPCFFHGESAIFPSVPPGMAWPPVSSPSQPSRQRSRSTAHGPTWNFRCISRGVPWWITHHSMLHNGWDFIWFNKLTNLYK